MAELVKVVVDAMGGDLAPVEPVKAAVEAVKERKDILVILTGQEEVIHSELKKYQDYPTDRIQEVLQSQLLLFIYHLVSVCRIILIFLKL